MNRPAGGNWWDHQTATYQDRDLYTWLKAVTADRLNLTSKTNH